MFEFKAVEQESEYFDLLVFEVKTVNVVEPDELRVREHEELKRLANVISNDLRDERRVCSNRLECIEAAIMRTLQDRPAFKANAEKCLTHFRFTIYSGAVDEEGRLPRSEALTKSESTISLQRFLKEN